MLFAGASLPAGLAAGAPASPAHPAVAAAPSSTAPSADLAVTVERDGRTVRFEATVDADHEADSVRLDGAFGVLNVTETDGFESAGDGYRLSEGRERATLVAGVDLGETRSTPLGDIGPDGPFQAGENWAFAPSPRFRLSWEAAGTTLERRFDAGDEAPGGNVSVDADAPVAVGDRFVFVGSHRVHVATGDSPTRLIVPDAAAFTVGADRALELAVGSYRAAGTTPDGAVTAFVLPRAARAGGAASDTDLWIRADASELTLAHEFAHAALALHTNERSRWLGEASAEYVAYRVAGPDDTVGVLTDRVTRPDAVLADRDSWHGDRVAYRKGAAVLALLDERIREVTDGERSVRSVFAALSASEYVDPVVLRKAVVDAAGEETAVWLAGYVGGDPATTAGDGPHPSMTPGLDQRFPEMGGDADTLPAAELSGLLAAVAAVLVLLWTVVRAGYRLFRRLRPGSAV